MEVNENAIKYIFTKKNLVSYIYGIVITSFIIFTSITFVIYKLYIDAYNNYSTILYQSYIPKDFSYFEGLELKCFMVNCKYITVPGWLVNEPTQDMIYYSMSKHSETMKYFLYPIYDKPFEFHSLTNFFTSDYNLVINYNNGYYVINDNSYIISAFKFGFVVWLIMVLMIFINNTRNFYNNYLNDLYEKGNYKMYLENKLQGNITEMIHHEINTPLTIIKTCTSKGNDILNKCYNNPNCNKLEDYTKLTEAINFAISRIEAVIFFLSSSKVFKHNNNNNIVESVKHIINNVNNSHIGKLNFITESEDTLIKYTTSDKLNEGQFLNIIHVLITNSIEAGANKIILSFNKFINGEYMSILINDNGRGIRDKTGEIFKNSGNTITKYAYSIKDKDGKEKFDNSFIYKVLKFFKVKIIASNTERGIGLYMNKTILKSCGGDINLHETSPNGTTFELIIPIREIKK